MACLLALAAEAIRSTRAPAMPWALNSVIAASSRRRLVSCESQGMPGHYNQLVGLTRSRHRVLMVASNQLDGLVRGGWRMRWSERRRVAATDGTAVVMG